MIAFTEFKVAALTSLLIFETTAIAVWWHYTRKRNKCVHPHDREEIMQLLRYAFDTPHRMQYEVLEVFRVTTPVLVAVDTQLTWSGRGTVSVRSYLSNGEIPLSSDGQTGKLNFSVPIAEPKRFGDVVLAHYILDLDDTSQQHVPMLSKSLKHPCQLVVLEVVLRYRSSCPAARLEWLPLDNVANITQAIKIDDVPFDANSRTFRAVVPHPIMGRAYRLVWDGQMPGPMNPS